MHVKGLQRVEVTGATDAIVLSSTWFVLVDLHVFEHLGLLEVGVDLVVIT